MAILLRLLFLLAFFLAVRFLFRTMKQRGVFSRRKVSYPDSSPDSMRDSAADSVQDLEQCPVCKHYVARTRSGGCSRAGCSRHEAHQEEHQETHQETHQGGLRRIGGVALLAVSATVGMILVTHSPVLAASSPSNPPPPSHSPSPAGSGGRYLVQVEGRGAIVTLSVNGIDVERWVLPHARTTAGLSVNHWLRQGSNAVSFRVDPVKAGETASSSSPSSAPSSPISQGDVRVRAWFSGVSSTGTLSSVNLIEQPVSLDGQGRGAVSVKFGVPSSPTLSLWLAETRTDGPSPAVCRKIVETTSRQIEEAYAARKLPAEIDVLALERQDTVRAYGGDPLQLALALSGETGDKRMTMSSLPEDAAFSVEPVKGLPLYVVRRKDGQPLVKAEAGGQKTVIHAMLVGWMSGEWRVFRRAY